MGKRGPKPGFKKARAAAEAARKGAATPLSSIGAAQENAPPVAIAPVAAIVPPPAPPAPAVDTPKRRKTPAEILATMPACDRENPEKLKGEVLRALAFRRGIARSQLEGMSDDKIRTQLRYITHRQYDEEREAA